jgi:hypothetical protein
MPELITESSYENAISFHKLKFLEYLWNHVNLPQIDKIKTYQSRRSTNSYKTFMKSGFSKTMVSKTYLEQIDQKRVEEENEREYQEELEEDD